MPIWDDPRNKLNAGLLQPVLPNQIGVPERNQRLPFGEIQTPERELKDVTPPEMPFFKDKNKMAMMLSVLSNGFGNMTLRGNSGLKQMNNAIYAQAAQKEKENKTMQYLAGNNPDMYRILQKIPADQRGDYMKLAMQSQFASKDPSAFVEKVQMIMAANPGMSPADAIKQAQSPSSVVNVNNAPSKGFGKFGETIATSVADWASGGRNRSAANLEEANRVVDQLSTAVQSGEDVTGTWKSFLPDSIRAAVDEEALDLQQSVERIVQQSLKETLGAQFAQKEAEQLFARAWNPKLSDEVNLRRVKRLLGEIESHHNTMDQMSSAFLKSRGDVGAMLDANEGAFDGYGAVGQFNDFDSVSPYPRKQAGGQTYEQRNGQWFLVEA